MQVKVIEKTVFSPEEMVEFGKESGHLLAKPNLILALRGDLGAGKTTFLKGFISFLTKLPLHLIQSPTFTYLQTYEISATFPLFHFDLYRLKSGRQFIEAGFFDYLNAGGICCIEWADRAHAYLPPETIDLEITLDSNPCVRHCVLTTTTSKG